jgi:hypothetical protein
VASLKFSDGLAGPGWGVYESGYFRLNQKCDIGIKVDFKMLSSPLIITLTYIKILRCVLRDRSVGRKSIRNDYKTGIKKLYYVLQKCTILKIKQVKSYCRWKCFSRRSARISRKDKIVLLEKIG